MTLAATIPGTSFALPLDIVVLGLVTGLTYALLAVGLVLTYRSSRVLNFAHGEMGAIGAMFVPILVVSHHVSYWLAVPVALAVSAAAGAFTEFVAIRQLAKGSPLPPLGATDGLGAPFFS